jgi:hypothetical protein
LETRHQQLRRKKKEESVSVRMFLLNKTPEERRAVYKEIGYSQFIYAVVASGTKTGIKLQEKESIKKRKIITELKNNSKKRKDS